MPAASPGAPDGSRPEAHTLLYLVPSRLPVCLHGPKSPEPGQQALLPPLCGQPAWRGTWGPGQGAQQSGGGAVHQCGFQGPRPWTAQPSWPAPPPGVHPLPPWLLLWPCPLRTPLKPVSGLSIPRAWRWGPGCALRDRRVTLPGLCPCCSLCLQPLPLLILANSNSPFEAQPVCLWSPP